MEMLGKYELTGHLSSQNSGYSVWGFGKKDGEDFFIKQFLSPKYPENDTVSSPERLQKKLQQCERFEDQKVSIYRALNENTDGNAVRVCEFFRIESKYYITMPKIQALPWGVQDVAALSEQEKRRLCAIIAHGIAGLHRGRIIHADLKHDNVLFMRTKAGSVTAKIIDFDSSFLETEPPAPGEDIIGDLVYFSPEACASIWGMEADLSCKMDIFSLGVLFHQYFSGELPGFDGEQCNYAGEAVAKGLPLTVSETIPEDVAELLKQMMSPDPVDRPDAEEVFRALSAAAGQADDPPKQQGKDCTNGTLETVSKGPKDKTPFFVPGDLDAGLAQQEGTGEARVSIEPKKTERTDNESQIDRTNARKSFVKSKKWITAVACTCLALLIMIMAIPKGEKPQNTSESVLQEQTSQQKPQSTEAPRTEPVVQVQPTTGSHLIVETTEASRPESDEPIQPPKETQPAVKPTEAPQKKAELESIAVLTLPHKTTYNVGEAVDLSGLKLTASYNDGTKKTISEGFTSIDTVVPNMATKQVIIVGYNGKTTTFEVDVLEFYSYEVEVLAMHSNIDSSVGYNDNGENVAWCLEITSRYHGGWVQFSFEDNLGVERGFTGDYENAWDMAKDGIAMKWGYSRSDQGFGDYHGGCAFILPDDPEFAGQYTASLTFGSLTKVFTFNLCYNGDYSSGTGWSISDVEWQ